MLALDPAIVLHFFSFEESFYVQDQFLGLIPSSLMYILLEIKQTNYIIQTPKHKTIHLLYKRFLNYHSTAALLVSCSSGPCLGSAATLAVLGLVGLLRWAPLPPITVHWHLWGPRELLSLSFQSAVVYPVALLTLCERKMNVIYLVMSLAHLFILD